MRLSGFQYFFIFGFLLWLVFIPILSVDQPPLADYPNHLARVYIWLTHNSPEAVPSVEPVLALQPNMAFELVTGLLSVFMPLEQAGRGFVLLTVVSTVLGPAVLGRVIWGSFSLWSFLPFLLIYNRLFFWGFLAYLFSLGIAIGLSSLWVRRIPREGRISWFVKASFFALLVLGFHLYAFAVFVLIASVLTARSASSLPAFGKEWVLQVFFMLLPLLVPLPVFVIGAPVFDLNHYIEWGPFIGKITSFGGLFVGPNARIDMMLGAVTVMLLAVVIYWGVLRKDLDCWLVGGVLLLIFVHLAMPAKLLSSYGADQRLPIAIALLGAAVIPPPRVDRIKVSGFLMICLLVVLFLRMISIRSDWATYQTIHKELVRAYGELPRRSNVLFLVGTSNPHGLPRIPLTEHAGFAVIAKSVFWPGLFAYPIHGAQTIAFSNIASIPFGIANLQKIPLSIIDNVISGVEVYKEFDLKDVSSCFQFVVIVREDGLAANLPSKAVFGSIQYRDKSVAIYSRGNHDDCSW